MPPCELAGGGDSVAAAEVEHLAAILEAFEQVVERDTSGGVSPSNTLYSGSHANSTT
jgi:hypothetical protein